MSSNKTSSIGGVPSRPLTPLASNTSSSTNTARPAPMRSTEHPLRPRNTSNPSSAAGSTPGVAHQARNADVKATSGGTSHAEAVGDGGGGGGGGDDPSEKAVNWAQGVVVTKLENFLDAAQAVTAKDDKEPARLSMLSDLAALLSKSVDLAQGIDPRPTKLSTQLLALSRAGSRVAEGQSHIGNAKNGTGSLTDKELLRDVCVDLHEAVSLLTGLGKPQALYLSTWKPAVLSLRDMCVQTLFAAMDGAIGHQQRQLASHEKAHAAAAEQKTPVKVKKPGATAVKNAMADLAGPRGKLLQHMKDCEELRQLAGEVLLSVEHGLKGESLPNLPIADVKLHRTGMLRKAVYALYNACQTELGWACKAIQHQRQDVARANLIRTVQESQAMLDGLQTLQEAGSDASTYMEEHPRAQHRMLSELARRCDSIGVDARHAAARMRRAHGEAMLTQPVAEVLGDLAHAVGTLKQAIHSAIEGLEPTQIIGPLTVPEQAFVDDMLNQNFQLKVHAPKPKADEPPLGKSAGKVVQGAPASTSRIEEPPAEPAGPAKPPTSVSAPDAGKPAEPKRWPPSAPSAVKPSAVVPSSAGAPDPRLLMRLQERTGDVLGVRKAADQSRAMARARMDVAREEANSDRASPMRARSVRSLAEEAADILKREREGIVRKLNALANAVEVLEEPEASSKEAMAAKRTLKEAKAEMQEPLALLAEKEQTYRAEAVELYWQQLPKEFAAYPSKDAYRELCNDPNFDVSVVKSKHRKDLNRRKEEEQKDKPADEQRKLRPDFLDVWNITVYKHDGTRWTLSCEAEFHAHFPSADEKAKADEGHFTDTAQTWHGWVDKYSMRDLVDHFEVQARAEAQ